MVQNLPFQNPSLHAPRSCCVLMSQPQLCQNHLAHRMCQHCKNIIKNYTYTRRSCMIHTFTADEQLFCIQSPKHQDITVDAEQVSMWPCGISLGQFCRIKFQVVKSLNVFETYWKLPSFPPITNEHYCDVIMGAVASQKASLTIVYSTVYPDAVPRKHQTSASLAFVRGIHRGPVNSQHKCPVTWIMFPFDDVIMGNLLYCQQNRVGGACVCDDVLYLYRSNMPSSCPGNTRVPESPLVPWRR